MDGHAIQRHLALVSYLLIFACVPPQCAAITLDGRDGRARTSPRPDRGAEPCSRFRCPRPGWINA